MAECIFCKKNNGYGGYSEGGCEHIDNVKLDEHSICKHFELVNETRAENILTVNPDRKSTYNYLKKYTEKV